MHHRRPIARKEMWQDERMQRLVLVMLALVSLGPMVRPAPLRAQDPEKAVPRAAQAEAPRGDLLDINVATAQELGALPGMGPVYARRVLEGRPYTAKNQLVTRGILPAGAYEQIKDRIVAHRVAWQRSQ
jgi:competence protein ComEA